MKAIVYHQFGGPDVLQREEVDTPTPAENQVLIQVRAAGLNPLDWRLMRGQPRIARKMLGDIKTPGRDVAGVVAAVGARVARFKPGDEVFGTCLGACAEYAVARERALVSKPASVTFEQAAGVGIAGLTALQGLRDKGRIEAGQQVLINGAGGGIGTFAVQIAKVYGADVTGVCSTSKVDLVRSLGASRAIDYTREDFTRSGERYDLILDNVGNRSASELRRALTPKGIGVIAGAPKRGGEILKRIVHALVLSKLVSQSFVIFIAKGSQDDLATLRDLMASGKLTPVVGRTYTLADIREAMVHLEDGHALGKIVVTP